jgi:phosphatidylglycerophosphate synthase
MSVPPPRADLKSKVQQAMKLPSLVSVLSAFVLALAFSGHTIDGASPDVGTNQWAAGPPLTEARADATATALGDGSVLVAGGRGPGGPTARVEVLTTSATALAVAPMSMPRAGHVAAPLGDGRVLVAGGTTVVTTEEGSVELPTASAEVFDATGSWTPVAALSRARSGARAVALPDGRVAVVGGRDAAGPVLEIEVFDPVAGGFVPGGALSLPREDAGVAVTRDGLIVVAGGSVDGVAQASADVIDPVTGVVGAVSLASPRAGATATATVDNRVLVIGGSDGTSELASTELIDPVTGASVAGPSLAVGRTGHAAFALPHNGAVLVVGGVGATGLAADAEVVIPWAGVVQATPAIAHPRTATAGADGAAEGLFLIAGGRTADGAASSATDYYGFATVKTDKDDYAPGEFVTITGTGWQPGETVQLVLHEVGTGAPDTPLNAVADEFGNFVNDFWAPNESHLGVRFYLTATGAHATAQTTFTDGNPQTLQIAAPATVTVSAGATATYVLDVTAGGNTSPCTLTFSISTGLPATVSSSFVNAANPGVNDNPVSNNPGNQNFSRTLHLTTAVTTTAGNYPFTVTAIRGSNCQGSGNLMASGTLIVQAAPDTTPPVMDLPGPQLVEAISAAGAIATYAASASDSVSGNVPVLCSPPSGSTFSLGTTTVNCSATDAAGNTATGSFSVTVQDTTRPAVTVPADITAEATSAAGAVVTFSASATDLVDGAVATTCAPASGSTFPLGPTEVTCSATDAAGNTGSASFSVTVQDTTAPVLQNMPASVTVEATGPDGATATYVDPTAVDLVDGSPTVVCAPASGSTFPLGPTTVTCTATDAAGNAASETFTVTVVDTTPPTLTLPDPITAEAIGPAGAAVTYAATAADLVYGTLTPSCVPASGSTFPLGATMVDCSATDAAGNTATGSFSVTVQDTTPPAVTVPTDITAEATSAAGAVVTFSASATDLVDGAVATTCAPASGSTFPLGPTEVTCSATDAAGNTGSASFSVTVQDTTAPVLQNMPASVTVEATGPGGATASYTDPTALDIVDASPTVVCAPASGGTFPLGDTVVTCTATDDFGNSSQAQFTVSVVDTTAPIGTVLINGGAAYATTAAVTLALTCADVATGCAEMQFSQDGGAYSAFEAFAAAKSITLAGADGAKAVYVRFRDGAGNVSAAYSDGITLDTAAPVITLTTPANGAAFALNQAVPAAYSCTDATSGIASCAGTVANGAAIDTATVGAKSFAVTATDLAGNTATVTHTYSVNYVFNGFFTPVLNGVWNVVNAGRAIPLKWQLTDAAGSFVLDLATVQSIYYLQVGCSSETISVPIEGYADDAGASELRIVGTDYQFNWKTQKSFANKCFELRLTLNDGSPQRTAKFKFSK